MSFKSIRAVAPFDAVVDTDLGLLRLVLDQFNNPTYLIPGIEKAATDLEKLKILIADRENPNPLSVVFKKEYEDNFGSLLAQFYDSHYDTILSLSGETSVKRLLTAAGMTSGLVYSTVVCTNQKQVDYINKMKLKLTPILIEDKESLLPAAYNVYYIKSISDLALFDRIEGKNIHIMEYRYNIDIENNEIFPKQEFIQLLADTNVLCTIPVYPKLVLPDD